MSWGILEIIAIICLAVSFFIGKNSIWGALTLGLVISFIAWIIDLVIGNKFHWSLYRHIVTISILIGTLFQFLPAKKKKSN